MRNVEPSSYSKPRPARPSLAEKLGLRSKIVMGNTHSQSRTRLAPSMRPTRPCTPINSLHHPAGVRAALDTGCHGRTHMTTCETNRNVSRSRRGCVMDKEILARARHTATCQRTAVRRPLIRRDHHCCCGKRTLQRTKVARGDATTPPT